MEATTSSSERGRADEALLAEIGWLTIQWARLEAYVDLLTAYISKNSISSIDKVPSAFNSRVKYVRRSLKSHAFINLYAEASLLLDLALAASRDRNDLVHGIVTSWHDKGVGKRTVLRQRDGTYVAIQDAEFDKSSVAELTKRIRVIGVALFNLFEKVKAIINFLNHDKEFWRIATLRMSDD